MKRNDQSEDKRSSLSRRTEELLAGKPQDLDKPPTTNIRNLIHELHVYQIELEMQNEQLRRAQLELEDSRNKYADLYDFAPVGYFTLDENCLIKEINLTGAALLRAERKYLIKRTFSHYIVREDHDVFYSYSKRLLETSTRQMCELKMLRKDGTKFYSQLEGIAVFDSGGSFNHFRMAMLNITERKRAEEALRRAHEELEQRVVERTIQLMAINAELIKEITERERAEAELTHLKDELTADLEAMKHLYELSTRWLMTAELQPLLEEVLDATMALLNADFGNVQLYDPVSGALKIIAQRGFRQDFLDYFDSVHEGTASCGAALQRRERVIVEDVLTDPVFAPHLKIVASAGYRAVQSTPLFSRSGEPLGMLSTHFRDPHRPSERELRLAGLYARQAAEMIELKRAEATLRESEERYRLLIEGVKDHAIFMLDVEGRVTSWNKEAEHIKGYKAEEIIGEHFSRFHPAEDVERGKPELGLKVTAEEGHYEDEGWRVRKDGTRFFANVVMTALRDDAGNLRGFSKVTRDITERKQAEEKLARSEAYLAEGQRLSHTGSWAWNVSTGDLYWSQEHFRIFGLDPETTKPSYQMFFQAVSKHIGHLVI